MPDGREAFAIDKIEISPQFVETTNMGFTPEKWFRYGDTSLKCGCKQWTRKRCAVIDDLIDKLSDAAESQLPNFPIRSACRWYDEIGVEACGVCPLVITNLPGEYTSQFISRDVVSEMKRGGLLEDGIHVNGVEMVQMHSLHRMTM
jgi:hypothetical protein